MAPPVPVAPTPADVPGVHSWSVPAGPSDPLRSLGGGVGWDEGTARAAAVGEALERYAAATAGLVVVDERDLPDDADVLALADLSHHSAAQASDPAYPHAESWASTRRTPLVDIATGAPVWVPEVVVTLDPARSTFATSNGLAAGPTRAMATLRALQELVERDAFMAVWLHQVAPPEVALPAARTTPVAERQGWVRAFDVTPAWSDHPVAVVAGAVPLGGRERRSLGMACRSTWAEAVDKAYLEWCQGVTFVGHRWGTADAGALAGASSVRTFTDHALYHSVRPGTWADLPLFAGDEVVDPPVGRAGSPDAELHQLVAGLGVAGVRTLAVELTTVDLHQVGLRVVRCVSPQLTPIHADHRWPHLGGTTSDLARRLPGARTRGPFPSPHPHPLG